MARLHRNAGYAACYVAAVCCLACRPAGVDIAIVGTPNDHVLAELAASEWRLCGYAVTLDGPDPDATIVADHTQTTLDKLTHVYGFTRSGNDQGAIAHLIGHILGLDDGPGIMNHNHNPGHVTCDTL